MITIQSKARSIYKNEGDVVFANMVHEMGVHYGYYPIEEHICHVCEASHTRLELDRTVVAEMLLWGHCKDCNATFLVPNPIWKDKSTKAGR